MKHNEFTTWLEENSRFKSARVIKDYVSRATRLEKEFSKYFGKSFTLEDEYLKDNGKFVKSMLLRCGEKLKSKQFIGIALPIGKNQMYCIISAVKYYFMFCEYYTKSLK